MKGVIVVAVVAAAIVVLVGGVVGERSDVCVEFESLTMQQFLNNQPLFVVQPATCKVSPCTGGDVGEETIREDQLGTTSGHNAGRVHSKCVRMPGTDGASLCHWSLDWRSGKLLELLGIAYDEPDKFSRVAIVGGAGEYEHATGSAIVMMDKDGLRRWFRLDRCIPRMNADNCQRTLFNIAEVAPVSDVLEPAIPGTFTPGLVDSFENDLRIEGASFPANYNSGGVTGYGTYVNGYWLSKWELEIPDRNNKISILGPLYSQAEAVARCIVVGGTGAWMNAKGHVMVTPHIVQGHNQFFLTYNISMEHSCKVYPFVRIPVRPRSPSPTAGRSSLTTPVGATGERGALPGDGGQHEGGALPHQRERDQVGWRRTPVCR